MALLLGVYTVSEAEGIPSMQTKQTCAWRHIERLPVPPGKRLEPRCALRLARAHTGHPPYFRPPRGLLCGVLCPFDRVGRPLPGWRRSHCAQRARLGPRLTCALH